MDLYTTTSILIAEDDEIDMMALERAINKMPDKVIHRASSFEEAQEVLAKEKLDLFITDYFLGDGEAIDLLKTTQVPTIFITGSNQIDLAVAAMKAGARDYLIKDVEAKYLDLLPIVIKRIEGNIRNQRKLLSLQAQFQSMIENTTDMVAILNNENSFEYINYSWEHKSGYDLKSLSDQELDFQSFFQQDAITALEELDNNGGSTDLETKFLDKNGTEHLVKLHISRNEDESGIKTHLVLTDISRKRALEGEIVNILNNSVKGDY